jgi:opacity protein-like surface antigen
VVIENITMCKKFLILFVLIIPLAASAQFQQRASLNLSAGFFKTLGEKTYMPDWGTSDSDREKFQMPNYRPGFSSALSFQYNINRRFSLLAEMGYMHSSSWEYIQYEDVNYLDWEFYDTITDELLAAGSDELTLTSMGFGLGVKYYLFQGKKISPFFFTTLNYNLTTADFTNNRWQAQHDLGFLEPDDSGPDNPWLEKNTGIGINPGMGAEYNFSDRIGVFLNCSYQFVSMKKENFKTPEQHENFHAINIRGGIKFSFWKSKEL